MRFGRKQRVIIETLSTGDWVAGPVLAARLGVPKYVLWPYIERLRDRGLVIEGDNRLGYRMAA